MVPTTVIAKTSKILTNQITEGVITETTKTTSITNKKYKEKQRQNENSNMKCERKLDMFENRSLPNHARKKHSRNGNIRDKNQ